MCRFVKAIQSLDLLNALGVHALCAPVAKAAAFGATAAGSTRFGFGQVLLNRAARDKLHNGKSDQQHAEQRGDHEQQALKDVDQHQRAHQVLMTQPSPEEYGGTCPGRPKRLSLKAMRWVVAVHCGIR